MIVSSLSTCDVLAGASFTEALSTCKPWKSRLKALKSCVAVASMVVGAEVIAGQIYAHVDGVMLHVVTAVAEPG